jgi:REP element-mobilizing transposase RayT
MKYNPKKHHRRSIRLQNYDYSSEGAYFVTMCTQNRECLFGEIVNGEMVLNEYGKIVEQCWFNLPNHYDNIKLDAYVIMPDHFHGIIFITDSVETVDSVDSVGAIHELPRHELPQRESPQRESPQRESPQRESPQRESQPESLESPQQELSRQQQRRKMLLPKIIGRFKMNSAKQINLIRNTPGVSVWQRDYYEHIIRDVESLENIRNYIVQNPSKWNDKEHNTQIDKK